MLGLVIKHAWTLNFQQVDEFIACIFFTITGDVLTPFRPAMLVKRIPRLSGTMTIGLVLMYILHRLGWLCEDDSTCGNLEEKYFLQFIELAWCKVYSFNTPNRMDDFLWVMPWQLRGSIIVGCIGAVLGHVADNRRIKWSLLVVLLVFFLNTFDFYYSFFVVGVLINQVRSEGFFTWCHNQRLIRLVSIGISVLLSLLLGTSHLVTGAAIIFLLYASKDAVRLLTLPVLTWLGQISFCMFVMQRPVLKTLMNRGIPPFLFVLLNLLSVLAFAICGHWLEVKLLELLDNATTTTQPTQGLYSLIVVTTHDVEKQHSDVDFPSVSIE